MVIFGAELCAAEPVSSNPILFNTITAYRPYAYTLIVKPLTPEDGGRFIAIVPDLPGCMSDGETPAEAAENVQDAIACWIEAAHDVGHVVPKPSRHVALAGADQ